MKLALALAAALVATSLFAQPAKFNIGIAASTLGGSVSASIRPVPSLGIRAVLNNGSIKRENFQQEDIRYDATLHLASQGALLDLYPNGGSFRLTGGVFNNRNHLDGRTREDQLITVNGTQYPAALIGYITASARVKPTAPYAGIGWTSSRRGLGFMIDAGALYQGSPRLTAEAHPTIPALVPQSFYTNLEAERAKTERDIRKYKWYPAVQLGLTYNF